MNTDDFGLLFDETDDHSLGLQEEAGEDQPKTQVETAISQVLPDAPEDTPSMLSTNVLQQLAQAPEGLPASFHQTQSIVDFATTVCVAVAEGKLKTSQSAELRKWAELMYTCIVANEPQQNNVQVNYVEQLIQLAGGTEAVRPDVVEVTDAISSPRKKAQGE